MITPIKPEEVKCNQIPDQVIDVFNKLIVKNIRGSSAVVKQEEAVTAIIAQFELEGKAVSRSEVYENGWLNVEQMYKEVGWAVSFDKPSYDESYEAYFRFSKK